MNSWLKFGLNIIIMATAQSCWCMENIDTNTNKLLTKPQKKKITSKSSAHSRLQKMMQKDELPLLDLTSKENDRNDFTKPKKINATYDNEEEEEEEESDNEDEKSEEAKNLIQEFYTELMISRIENEQEHFKLKNELFITKNILNNQQLPEEEIKKNKDKIIKLTKELYNLETDWIQLNHPLNQLITTEHIAPMIWEKINDVYKKNPNYLRDLLQRENLFHETAFDDLFYKKFSNILNDDNGFIKLFQLYLLQPHFATAYLRELEQDKDKKELASSIIRKIKNELTKLLKK